MDSIHAKLMQSLPEPQTKTQLRDRGRLLPGGDLHGSLLRQVLVHLEGLEEQVGLVAHALLQALELGPVEVVLQDGLVFGVRAVLDDDAGTLARRETTNVSQTLILAVSIFHTS